MSEVFRSSDDEAVVRKLRDTVLISLGTKPENFDKRVTCGQLMNFVEQYRTEEGYLEFDHAALEAICNFVKSSAVGTILAKLAADGIVESRWDDEMGEMVFQLSDAALKDCKEE